MHMKGVFLGKLLLPLGISQAWKGSLFLGLQGPQSIKEYKKEENIVNIIGSMMNGCQVDKYII